MMILGVILLAVSLSMDSFGIGISYGIRSIKISVKAKIIMCFISIVFTSISMLLGNILTNIIPYNLSKFIGAGMLILFGLFIIFESFYKKIKVKNDNDRPKGLLKNLFNFLGISIKIIRNPICGDIDKSSDIDCREAIYLGVALSIDAFGAGIGYAVSGFNSMFIPVVTAVFQYVFLSCGWFFGKRLRIFNNVDSQIFVVISGALLIVLSVVRLLLD